MREYHIKVEKQWSITYFNPALYKNPVPYINKKIRGATHQTSPTKILDDNGNSGLIFRPHYNYYSPLFELDIHDNEQANVELEPVNMAGTKLVTVGKATKPNSPEQSTHTEQKSASKEQGSAANAQRGSNLKK